ncbi:MAG TPA: type ISP restriction/modification enzyme, partial [Candidatus Brocadiaceae bacterium]
EFLKIDFPRIPFTKDYKLFIKMGDYGKRFVDLHLLRSPEIDPPVAKFQGKGDNKVDKLKYENARLFINNDQYFEGIEPEVFEYQIGGYQVCEKWLKDRKDRKLSLEDIKHYCNVVTTLQKTIEIQKAIDDIYQKVESDVIRKAL